MSNNTARRDANDADGADAGTRGDARGTLDGGIDHRVLMASAGTGKTYQLTNRMIALLVDGARPSEMVATTFTRKAAGEILERVVERLVEGAEDERARARLGEAIGRPLDRQTCERVLARIASSLDRMSVLTIDSLFGRMASALELELAAQAARKGGQDEDEEQATGGAIDGTGIGERRIADDAEDEEIRATALAMALEEGSDEELLALVRLLLDGHAASRLSERMLESIRAGLSILHETREGGREDQTLDPWRLPDVAGAPCERLTRAQVRDLLAKMNGMKLPSKKGDDGPDGRWEKGHRASMELAAIDSWDAFLAGGLGKAAPGGTYYRAPFPDELLAAYRTLVAHATGVLREQLEQRTRATRDLLVRFERVYERIKAQRGVWRFEDVPRTLLAHVRTPLLERLYYRMDARVQHLLLDEFQDTSITSFELLEPVIAEIVASAPPERSFFCVGDVKQSLYVWNRAEPELLPAIARRWEQIHRAELVESWRSSPVVLEAVNRVMGTLADNQAMHAWPGVCERWNEMFTTHTARHKGMPGEVGVHVPASALEKQSSKGGRGKGQDAGTPGEDPGEPDLEEDAKAMVRTLVARALERAPGASVAILVRANARIAPLVHALREAGINASEEGGSSLYDTMPVGALRSAFQLAAHPSDSAACYHVATSPLGEWLGIEWSEGARMIDRAHVAGQRLRARIARDGLAKSVAWMVSGIGAKTDARGLRRLEQVVELARRIDEIPGAGIDAFIDALDRERMKDPGASGVRVMTIHASKGLEFDVVILADVDGRMVGAGSPLVVDRPGPTEPIRHVMCRPSAALQAADPALAGIVRKATERTLIEGLCVLYVAMTRARHSLQVVLGPSSIKEGDASSETVYPGRLIAAALVPEWPTITESGAVYEHSVGDWAREVSARSGERGVDDAEPERVSFTLKPSPAHERRTARLMRVSPSSLEGGETRTLGEMLRPASDEGRLRGTLLHGMFEQVRWSDEEAPSTETLMACARSIGADDEAAREGVEAVKRALGSAEIAHALSLRGVGAAAGERVELWREKRFAVRSVRPDGEPVLLNGQFDRVVVVRDSEQRGGLPVRAILQDFKTDDVRDEAMLRSRVEHYTPQVEAYRGAIATMLGLEPARVRAMLLFTELGRVVEIGAPTGDGT